MIMRTSTSHEEGCDRHWNILTKEFVGNDEGQVTGLRIADIVWQDAKPGERPSFDEVAGSERVIPCDLAFLVWVSCTQNQPVFLRNWISSLMSAVTLQLKISKRIKRCICCR